MKRFWAYWFGVEYRRGYHGNQVPLASRFDFLVSVLVYAGTPVLVAICFAVVVTCLLGAR